MTSGDPGAALVAERILFALTEDEGMLARFARCHRLGRGSDASTNCRNFSLRSLERPAQFRSCAVPAMQAIKCVHPGGASYLQNLGRSDSRCLQMALWARRAC